MYCPPVERQGDEASPWPSPLDHPRRSGALANANVSMPMYCRKFRNVRIVTGVEIGSGLVKDEKTRSARESFLSQAHDLPLTNEKILDIDCVKTLQQFANISSYQKRSSPSSTGSPSKIRNTHKVRRREPLKMCGSWEG